MKITNLYQLVGASMLAASLAVMPSTLPAQAQVEPEGEVEAVEAGDNDFDWGWLGLLGLIGLAGLAGRNRQEPVHTQPLPTDAGTRSGSDYR